eukprot:100529-Hanusia_phi.AAC.3
MAGRWKLFPLHQLWQDVRATTKKSRGLKWNNRSGEALNDIDWCRSNTGGLETINDFAHGNRNVYSVRCLGKALCPAELFELLALVSTNLDLP